MRITQTGSTAKFAALMLGAAGTLCLTATTYLRCAGTQRLGWFGTSPLGNAPLESLVLHFRNVIDFLYPPTEPRPSGKITPSKRANQVGKIPHRATR